MKYRTVGLVNRNVFCVSHFVVQKIMKRLLGHAEVEIIKTLKKVCSLEKSNRLLIDDTN